MHFILMLHQLLRFNCKYLENVQQVYQIKSVHSATVFMIL